MKKITILLFALIATLVSSAQDNTTGKIIEINQDQFNELIADINNPDWAFKGQRPAVVDFSAVWCGPCRKMTPILEQLAKEFSDNVDFYSVNVDNNKDLAVALGVRNIPLIIFCPMDGNPSATVGLQDYDTILSKINEILAEK